MAKLIFKDIGRSKWCGEVQIANPDGKCIVDTAVSIAEKHLLSRDVDASFAFASMGGNIYAGGRCVGSFKLEK